MELAGYRRAARTRFAPRRQLRLARQDAMDAPHTGSALCDLAHPARRDSVMATRAKRRLDDNPLWYKDAVIYQLHVKSFFDSNNDGVGDFPGLTQKLDYIRDLGVDTIWLLPFYPSPMRDDGYDVSDYHNIYPLYG